MVRELGRVFILGDYLQSKKTVIYGACDTSRTLYNQFVEKGLEVVAVVDRSADSLENVFSCPLIKPEVFSLYYFSHFFEQIRKLRKGYRRGG